MAQSITKKLTQQEKSTHMRQRLINATLECLQEFGFHGSSLSRILEKAGVSRGAWRHHYESKNDLVSAASEYLLSTAITRAHELAANVSVENRNLSEILEFIWEKFYQGNYRDVWVEFNVACRTDSTLKERLTPVIHHFFAEMDSICNTYLAHLSTNEISAETVMNLSLYLMRGMAIQSISMDDPDHYREMRDQWVKMILHLTS